MEGTDLSKLGSDWIVPLNKLPSLSELHLSFCSLRSFKSSLNVVNFTSLAVLDLSLNDFHSEIPNWLSNITSLESINLRSSKLYGTIPLGLTGLQNLRSVDLAKNKNLTGNCSQLFAGSWRMAEYVKLEFIQLHG
ncbi:hypothetical protein Patl1_17136 [Pistacia atlantica]|uniref:Uncharacterized protein n=1 Tax=Pistacia atlantica TaxID=434234 RepID=A0ACC1B5C9_9ROSI|nr:hypothetical protein Patl1_17136 [Pistacia atlantica]